MERILKVVLASASPRRWDLLSQIGIEADIMPSGIREVIKHEEPGLAVMDLSYQKAKTVSSGCPSGTLVIGADTVVFACGRILGKPADEKEAARMIRMLEGKIHQVFTGVTLVWKGEQSDQTVSFFEKTDVEVYPMSETEVKAYAACGEPLDKAGAYGIQGRFAAYMKGIRGDYSNVVGLPVGRVYQEMKRLCRWKENHD